MSGRALLVLCLGLVSNAVHVASVCSLALLQRLCGRSFFEWCVSSCYGVCMFITLWQCQLCQRDDGMCGIASEVRWGGWQGLRVLLSVSWPSVLEGCHFAAGQGMFWSSAS